MGMGVGSGFLNQLLAQQRQTAPQLGPLLGFISNIGQQSIARKEAAARAPLLAAQTQRALQQAKTPFAGQILPGAAGQVQGLEILKSQFGPNSPQYNQALGAFNSTVKAQNARADYYEANHWLKNLPTLNKAQMYANFQTDQAQRQQQNLPTQTFGDWYQTQGKDQVPVKDRVTKPPAESSTLPLGTEDEAVNLSGGPHAPNEPPVIHSVAQQVPPETQVTPEEAKLKPEDFTSESAQTQANIQKLTSDPATRAKALNFQTINQIIGGVDPNMIEFYSAPKGVGQARIAADRALSVKGTVIPRFQNYNSFIRITVPTLADKIRQAYGTSITPEMFRILKNVSNPINWKDNPSLAIASWNKLSQLMQEQGGVYNQALGAPVKVQVAPPQATRAVDPVQLTNAQLLQIARGQ